MGSQLNYTMQLSALRVELIVNDVIRTIEGQS
ncbi:MAG: hypothetical protein ACJAYX_003340 [Planctomycetota bacterium]|jgi:hypothetical protein